jgi:hypothetical protein
MPSASIPSDPGSNAALSGGIAAKYGGVYLNFSIGIGESLLLIASRGMQYLSQGLLTAIYKRLRGLPITRQNLNSDFLSASLPLPLLLS